jgi:hypothetical protein
MHTGYMALALRALASVVLGVFLEPVLCLFPPPQHLCYFSHFIKRQPAAFYHIATLASRRHILYHVALGWYYSV